MICGPAVHVLYWDPSSSNRRGGEVDVCSWVNFAATIVVLLSLGEKRATLSFYLFPIVKTTDPYTRIHT